VTKHSVELYSTVATSIKLQMPVSRTSMMVRALLFISVQQVSIIRESRP